jgi:hypothetical protein
LTILIGHKDGRSSNFLVSVDEADRRVFSIDNGIAFDPWIYNFFVANWDTMRVGAVNTRSIERIRALADEDFEALGVIAELRMGEDSLLHCAPPTRNLDPTCGARLAQGLVQFGLSQDEITAVRTRRAGLLDAIEKGEVALL